MTPEEEPTVRTFNLLTAKPMLYAANVAEGDAAHGNDHAARARGRDHVERRARLGRRVLRQGRSRAGRAAGRGAQGVRIARTRPNRASIGLRAAYQLLGLRSYFTAGEKEVRLDDPRRRQGARRRRRDPPDFEKGFIRAETVAFDDFVSANIHATRARQE